MSHNNVTQNLIYVYMLKFSTVSPFRMDDKLETILKVKPLITPPKTCKLKSAILRGKDAFIVGKALELAGFFLPCFYDGDMKELDNPDGNIVLVLPSGEYPIVVTIDEEQNYLLDLA